MSTFIDRYADELIYEAATPADEELVSCVCGHTAYQEDAVIFDDEWYCSDECKNKAVFEAATPEDYKEFVLGEWNSFLEYLFVNQDEFIREKLEYKEPTQQMWAEAFKEYAKDDLSAFADWYENREPIPYRRTA